MIPTMQKHLPKELTSHVSWVISLLGTAIERKFGSRIFKIIEDMRKLVVQTRDATDNEKQKILKSVHRKLKNLSDEELSQISHSYLLMLEAMNRCETVYRIHKIRERDEEFPKPSPNAITYVLTAHPTEARSESFLKIGDEIQHLISNSFGHQTGYYKFKLIDKFTWALGLKAYPSKKPRVIDEAKNIYRHLLKSTNIEETLYLNENDINLRFRSWVGGDKDGHPGVTEKTFIESLSLSRKYILKFFHKQLSELNVYLLETSSPKILIKNSQSLLNDSKKLTSIKKGDYKRVKALKDKLYRLRQNFKKYYNSPTLYLDLLSRLFEVYPALVVPLEIREDSEVVAQALVSRRPLAIEKILKTLHSISDNTSSTFYARGFILSMVEDASDVKNGIALVKKVFKGYLLPVIPLFENEKALLNAPGILKGSINQSIINKHQKSWNSKYEVMLGYSDSSKENGVFPSRLLIFKGMRKIDTTLKSLKLKPIYFHGSGGSIERGGGSVKEQISSWPKTALENYKVTVQGEMVSRTLSSAFILKSQTLHIAQKYSKFKSVNQTEFLDVFQKFSNCISDEYKKLVADDNFWFMIEKSTPYQFLSELKIGSRPTKRQAGAQSRKLRAIPWILCWTQTRVFLPTWWGVGTSYQNLSAIEKELLKKAFKESPLFASFVKQLGFTLEKMSMAMWHFILTTTMSSQNAKHYFMMTYLEYRKVLDFYHDITGEKRLLFFRPWLEESIRLRTPMIHPLNIIQLEALKRENYDLLRETVTGISCGMMTTG
jgi:phosphoenolpyruvate carboxylase